MNDWIEHPWERQDREIREALEKKDTEIERLKTLCGRASDALAGCTWQERDALIAELRKAAE